MHRLKLSIMLIAALVLAAVGSLAISNQAKAITTFYHGGVIVFILPPIDAPPAIECPEGIVIYDFATQSSKILFETPFSIVYPNFNLFTPGTFVKGLNSPIELSTCPYPMYPIVMIGTS